MEKQWKSNGKAMEKQWKRDMFLLFKNSLKKNPSASLLRQSLLIVASIKTTGCYSLQQGYSQARLLWKRVPVQQVLAQNSESQERIEKLKWVPEILEFAKNELKLTPGTSYHYYIPLPTTSVTYVVQAAYRRELKRKSWWFPIIGTQPYLGFFNKEDAKKEEQALKSQGFDTTLGGVQAFSMLGFFPDPLYSSMLDNNSLPELAELLIHETLHRTIYIPNYSSFNENLADFVGKKGAVLWMQKKPELADKIKDFQEEFTNELEMQKIFITHLERSKKQLETFFEESKQDPNLTDEDNFLKKRQDIYSQIADEYRKLTPPHLTNTGYARAFNKERLNNAVFLGYSLYESKQSEFETLYQKCHQDIPKFVEAVRSCLSQDVDKEERLWEKILECNP